MKFFKKYVSIDKYNALANRVVMLEFKIDSTIKFYENMLFPDRIKTMPTSELLQRINQFS